MYSRLIKRPLRLNKSFFLFGPRGTGKTTWLKQTFPDSIYIDLLDSDNYRNLLANPKRIENFIPNNYSDWIILDEIQRVPDLLNEVHKNIESNNYKFILTGSSARSLRKKGVNLLAGRALTFHLYPLTVKELKDDFSLEKSLKYGNLPFVYNYKSPSDYLYSYVETYLREEILQEGLTRNLAAFSRFLESASFSQGSLLNISEVARDAGIERKTVENYFTILSDLLLSYFLPVFTKKAKRRLVKHSKFFFFDAGIYSTIRPKGPLDSPEDIEGQALETLVYQELLAINEYFGFNYNLYFWRTSNGQEVDFVLYGEKGLLAFEVKRSSRLKKEDLAGLRSFKNDYPQAKCYYLYGGDHKEYWDSIQVLPVIYALKNLSEILSNKR